jgi:hypothetical protein
MKFQVLHGVHREGGKVYKKGDVIKSDEDLVKKWDQKFRKVDEDAKVAEGAESLRAARGEENKEDDEEGRPPKRSSDSAEATSEDAGGEGVTSKLGEDVTSDFAEDAGSDLLVLKKGRNWSVAEREDPDTAVNEHPLKHGEVKDFIKKYLEG